MNYKLIYLANRNPNIAPEEFPSAWRSHSETARKLPSVGTSIVAAIDSVNYCARIRDPKLDGAPFEPPGASTAYDGVAVVSSIGDGILNVSGSTESRAALLADEVRVFGRNVREFALYCREDVALGGPAGPAAVIRFLRRKPGLALDDFLARWKGPHADLARPLVAEGKVIRFAQNTPVREPPPGFDFDGVSEAWFASVEDAVRSFSDPAQAALSQDLAALCDMDRSVTMLTEVIFHRQVS